jgi:hypothetical protein
VSRLLLADGDPAARPLSASPAMASGTAIDGRAAVAAAAQAPGTPLAWIDPSAGDAAAGIVPELATGELSSSVEAAGIAGVAEAWSLTGLRTQLAAIAGSVAVLVAGGYTYLRGRRVAARAEGAEGEEEADEPIEFTLRH